jgi:RiboL-PSP-HEPN
MSDADELVALVRALTNSRQRAMRTELRQRVGEALKVPERDRSRLACIESDDLFVTFRPGSRIGPSDIADLRPLLRQALVAACAALETYLADKIMEQVGPLLRKQENLTPRLAAIPLSLIDFVRIQETYERHGWGLRVGIVEPFVREKASTAPNRVGEVLSLIGISNWPAKIDNQRGVAKGSTETFLARITARRNRIAHEADREGRRRASLTVDEVADDLEALRSIVVALEAVVGAATANAQTKGRARATPAG